MRDVFSSVRAAQAELAAEGGINLIALDLVSARDDRWYTRKFRLDGVPVICSLGDVGTLIIKVQDSSGLINLNLANDRLIAAALIGYGVDTDKALAYADRILDFRDADEDRRAAGAEKDDYIAAGIARGSRDAPLDSMTELHQVLGLPPDVIALIASLGTLHSGTAALDLSKTSPELRAAVEKGLEALPVDDAPPAMQSRAPEFSAASLNRYYVVRVDAILSGGGQFARLAEIDAQGARGSLPKITSWSRGEETAASPDSPGEEPCGL